MTKTPFTKKSERSKELLGLIHTDIYGPMNIHFIGGYTYFIIFIYDHSRYGYMYLMKYKSESFERFKESKNKIKIHTEIRIKKPRLDRGS
jgi:hypothetical protein